VLAHAKVIIRAPDHDLAPAVRRMPCCVRETPCDALEIRKHAVAPFLVKPGERGGKEMIIGHEPKSPLMLHSTTGTLPIQSAPCPFDPEPSLVGPGEGAAGPREGGPAAGAPRRRGAPGQALAKLCVSARQIGIRQRASLRVKQSKSLQIVANAHDRASTTFAGRT